MSGVGQQCLKATHRLLSHFDTTRITIERREAALVLSPNGVSGYAVSLYDQGEDAMITAERWHAHYEEPEQMAWCAYWLLTPFYRVVHELKSGVLMSIWVERYDVEGWDPFEPVYFANPEYPPDWELKPGEAYERRYFQQNLVTLSQPYEEICPGVQLKDGLPPGFGLTSESFEEALGPALF